MPNPGQVNNPDGANGTTTFAGYKAEQPYGARKQLEQLGQSVPTAAITAPDRARRRSQRGKQQPQAQPPVPVDQQLLAAAPLPQAVWQAVAADPGASPLVREYAAEALR